MGGSVFTYSNNGQSVNLQFVTHAKTTVTAFVPPTLDEVLNYFESKGYSGGDKYHQYYSEAEPPWTDKSGSAMKNWQAKARQVWFTPERKIAKKNEGPMSHMIM